MRLPTQPKTLAIIPHDPSILSKRSGRAYLRDSLLVLSTEENGPRDAAGVLALKEEGLGLAVLESEDLAVSTDVELALLIQLSVSYSLD